MHHSFLKAYLYLNDIQTNNREKRRSLFYSDDIVVLLPAPPPPGLALLLSTFEIDVLCWKAKVDTLLRSLIFLCLICLSNTTSSNWDNLKKYKSALYFKVCS